MTEELETTTSDLPQQQVSTDELDAIQGEAVPDREAMSLVNANVAVPVDAAVSANVLSDHSTANSQANQTDPISQTNRG